MIPRKWISASRAQAKVKAAKLQLNLLGVHRLMPLLYLPALQVLFSLWLRPKRVRPNPFPYEANELAAHLFVGLALDQNPAYLDKMKEKNTLQSELTQLKLRYDEANAAWAKEANPAMKVRLQTKVAQFQASVDKKQAEIAAVTAEIDQIKREFE